MYKVSNLFFSLLLAGIISFVQATPAKNLLVLNPTAVERVDELIVLSRSLLIKKTGVIPAKGYVQIAHNGRPVVVQFDDLNGDGTWDEAAFLYSFQPFEKVVFTIKTATNPATIKAVVRAHVRQQHKLPDESFGPSLLRDTMPYNNQPTDFTKQKLPPYLTEGPGWENDKVGFRKYFDVRNANDIWGKVTARMMLDEVGVDPSKIYHHFDSSWGMDILKVGKSLGAGGLALQVKLAGKDSLVRFGTNTAQTTYQQVADGPVRAIFRMNYKGWEINNLLPIDATEEISIWGGQYFYQNKVTLSHAPAGAKLVTGVNNFYVKAADTTGNTNTKVLYTYGKQSENGDNLGLAVLVPAGSFAGIGQTPDAGSEVLNTFIISQKILPGHALLYRYYAAWEKTNKQFTEKDGFEDFIKSEAVKAFTPLRIL